MASFRSIMCLLVALNITVVIGLDICADKDKPDFLLNLKGALIAYDYLLLIDKDFLVYEVPTSSFSNNNYGRMLFNITGVPLEDRWTHFKTNKTFNEKWNELKRNKNLYFYHYMDQYRHILLIDGNGVRGICYDLIHNTWCIGLEMNENWPQQLISEESMKRRVFVFSYINNQFVARIWKYHFYNDGAIYDSSRYLIGRLFYVVNKSDPKDKRLAFTTNNDETIPPFVDMSGKSIPNMENYYLDDSVPTDWHVPEHIPVGFIYKGSVYLYDLHKVIIFEDILPKTEQLIEQLQKPNVKNRILDIINPKVIAVKDYFLCESGRNENATHATYPADRFHWSTQKSSDTWIYIIIAVVCVLAVLVVIALVVYCCYFNEKKEKNEKKKSNSKPSRAGSKDSRVGSTNKAASSACKKTSVGAVSNQQTKRSANL